jgi:diaminopimelate epimerase
MEGLGNDYIYVEEFIAPLQDPPSLARRMSDRHFGVGGDGLVLIGPPEAGLDYQADFRMRMFNADGSEGDMCGNAARCVGKYLYEKGFTKQRRIRLQTKAGMRLLELDAPQGMVCSVRVNMGHPVLRPELIPMLIEGENFISRELSVKGKTYMGTAVSMGNPHLVVPCPDLAAFPLESLGPAFEHHPLFPRRVNTEFIQVLNRERVRMRVWERGSGETLACGTGACAALAACVLNGWTDRKAVLELRGGELEIEWADDDCIYMRGPATEVFSGEFMVIK